MMRESSTDYIPEGYIQEPEKAPADIYEQCLNLWQHGWDDAYAEGASKAEKHKVRRDKLVEYLQTVDIPTLVSFIENRIMDCEARAMENPRRREYYLKERAAAQGILTVITKERLTSLL